MNLEWAAKNSPPSFLRKFNDLVSQFVEHKIHCTHPTAARVTWCDSKFADLLHDSYRSAQPLHTAFRHPFSQSGSQMLTKWSVKTKFTHVQSEGETWYSYDAGATAIYVYSKAPRETLRQTEIQNERGKYSSLPRLPVTAIWRETIQFVLDGRSLGRFHATRPIMDIVLGRNRSLFLCSHLFSF